MIVGVADEPELVLEGLGFGIQCIRTTNKLKEGRERYIERGKKRGGEGAYLLYQRVPAPLNGHSIVKWLP